MRLKLIVITVAVIALLGCADHLTAVSSGACDVPPSLREELAKRYPGTHIVRQDDLDQYYRSMFRKLHGKRCPGVARVNFYGDGNPTYAVVLISGENPKRKAELVVASLSGTTWSLRSLAAADGTPVIWQEQPGAYEGMYDDKKIRARNSVIAFAGLESWEVVYIWTGKDVAKVQVLD